MYGFGAEFYVSPQVGLRAMYNNYGKFDTFDPPVKVSSFTLGMVYNFSASCGPITWIKPGEPGFFICNTNAEAD